MPVWAAIVVALLTGLGGGLLGTVMKLNEDRKASVRAETIAAAQAFAALATESFDLVGTAITRHEDQLGPPDDGSREAAEHVLKEGRTRLDRLAVLVGPRSELVALGAFMNKALALALDSLPPTLADIDPGLAEPERTELEALDDDAHFVRMGELQGDLFDGSMRRARRLHDHGLTVWGDFAQASATELNQGLFPRLRRRSRAVSESSANPHG